MNRKILASALTAATLAIVCGTAAAQLSQVSPAASTVMAYQLAQHPQCFASYDGTVVVWGAVAHIETHEPAPGVTVVLQYGNARARATSSDDGTYTATFTHVQPGAVVREVGIYTTATGSLLPLPHAQAFAGTCRPVRVHVGALRPVGRAK